MAKRPDVDWVAVQALYMADQLSMREIGRRYGVSNVAILKRAKKEGWSKDLSRRVVAGVKEAVVSSKLTTAPKSKVSRRETANQDRKVSNIIKAAIEEGKAVVLKHQDVGKLLISNAERLAKLIEKKIIELENQDSPDEGLLNSLTKAFQSLTIGTSNTIGIERQARGLDDLPADPTAPPSISITYYRQDLVLPPGGQGPGVHQAPAIELKKGETKYDEP